MSNQGSVEVFDHDAEAASARDVDILNFALCLEYLQAAFYMDAEKMRKLRGKP